MEEKIVELAQLLQESNDQLSAEKAKTWVELLWSDFEATYARAGYTYKGAELTEKMIRQWIESYGATLHEFVARNPKYADLLK
ncbi:MAG TPA: YfhJ family protein [Kurthia sp.]